jgi:hypothetical protein
MKRKDGRQLNVKQIWQMLEKDRLSSNQSLLEVVTQFEHPLLGRPFFAGNETQQNQ